MQVKLRMKQEQAKSFYITEVLALTEAIAMPGIREYTRKEIDTEWKRLSSLLEEGAD